MEEAQDNNDWFFGSRRAEEITMSASLLFTIRHQATAPGFTIEIHLWVYLRLLPVPGKRPMAHHL